MNIKFNVIYECNEYITCLNVIYMSIMNMNIYVVYVNVNICAYAHAKKKVKKIRFLKFFR